MTIWQKDKSTKWQIDKMTSWQNDLAENHSQIEKQRFLKLSWILIRQLDEGEETNRKIDISSANWK